MITWNRTVGRFIVVMPCRATSCSIRSGSGLPGWITQAPPDSSGPHSSSAKASQETGAHCSQTVSGPKRV